MAGNKKRITSSKKKKLRKNLDGNNNNAPVNPSDINDVLTQADAALESSNIENAMQLYTYASGVLRRKLHDSSKNMAVRNQEREADILLLSKVLGKMAEGKVSLGDQEGAQHDFLEATNLLSGDGPENNPIANAQWKEARASLFLYLGQLSCGTDALQAFTKSVDDLRACVALLENVLKSNPGDESMKITYIETKRQLCGAFCSVSELYLTDLCFEPNAEQNCDLALQEALKLDDPQSSPDAVQAMANLRLSQNRGVEAVAFMLDAYSRVKVGVEAMADLVGLGVDNGTGNMREDENVAKELKGQALDAANSLPGFEFRCQMSKLLLECGSLLDEDHSKDAADRNKQRQICVEAAIQVLGSLLAENDEVIEIWFLLGCAFSSTEPKIVDASKHYFETSLTMLEKVKKGMKRELQSDDDLNAGIADIDSKIQDVKRRLQTLCDSSSKMEED